MGAIIFFLLLSVPFFSEKGVIANLEEQNKKFNKFIDYQEYLHENTNNFYKDELNCVQNGFVMSLKNNNFLKFIMNPQSVIPEHIFKNQKKPINSKLRLQVWFKEFGSNYEGVCPFYQCQNKINCGLYGYHSGHIISEFNGGLTTLENLRPICASCNCKMGAKNWIDYEKECKQKYRINKKKNIFV